MKSIKNVSLKKYNTLGVDATARSYFSVDSTSELLHVLTNEKLLSNKLFVLGQGANILFTSDFEGTIVQTNIKGIQILDENSHSAIVEVGSGVLWHDLVTFAVQNNWGGIENMALIPGSVGGAVVGNIAAYGQNLSESVVSVTFYNLKTHTIQTLTQAQCEFTYRDSIFKNKLQNKIIIINVRFKLNKNTKINTEYWSDKHGSIMHELKKNKRSKNGIRDVYNAIISLRTSKFPDMKQYGTAGSFFKNPKISIDEFKKLQKRIPSLQYYPEHDLHYVKKDEKPAQTYVKVPVGGILDKGMGLSGLWHGNVGLYENHAALLITKGHITGEEVVSFAQFVQNEFFNFCGIHLEPEVLYV